MTSQCFSPLGKMEVEVEAAAEEVQVELKRSRSCGVDEDAWQGGKGNGGERRCKVGERVGGKIENRGK